MRGINKQVSSREASGKIRLDHEYIVYQLPDGGWQLPVSEIKIVGEHTDDQGPMVDDYFLVFLTDSNVYEAPFYAEGVTAFLHELGNRLGAPLSCELGNSTNYRSRIMWPSEMEGLPVFDYFKSPKPDGLAARLMDKLFPDTSRKLSDAVRQKLNLV